MSSSQDVINYRRRRKEDLVTIMGGKCIICEYNKCADALDFHHINAEEKEYGLSSGNCQSLEKDIIEVQKCALLCANCHREFHASLISQGQIYCSFDEDIAFDLVQSKLSEKKYCLCGKEINKHSKTCSDCYRLSSRITERPSRQELKNLIKNKPFTEIAKQFSVSDNAIRKWCVAYNLPSKKTEISKYSDEEWNGI